MARGLVVARRHESVGDESCETDPYSWLKPEIIQEGWVKC